MRLAVAVLIVAGCVALHAQDARRFEKQDERTTTRTLRFAGPRPRTLDVRTVNGSIHVSAYDGDAVELTTRRTTWAESDTAAREAERSVTIEIADGGPEVTAVVHDDGDTCGDTSFHRSRRWFDPEYHVRIDFTVRVPRDSRLRLCAINGGDISVDGTAGDFDVSNVNGRITMTNVRGSGRAATVNGPVTVLFAANPTARSAFTTVNGTIEATFAGALSADLRMKTFHGGLYTDYEVQPITGTTIDRIDGRGRHLYRANAYTIVTAGGGGPELTFDTLNGDVRILRRDKQGFPTP